MTLGKLMTLMARRGLSATRPGACCGGALFAELRKENSQQGCPEQSGGRNADNGATPRTPYGGYQVALPDDVPEGAIDRRRRSGGHLLLERSFDVRFAAPRAPLVECLRIGERGDSAQVDAHRMLLRNHAYYHSSLPHHRWLWGT